MQNALSRARREVGFLMNFMRNVVVSSYVSRHASARDSKNNIRQNIGMKNRRRSSRKPSNGKIISCAYFLVFFSDTQRNRIVRSFVRVQLSKQRTTIVGWWTEARVTRGRVRGTRQRADDHISHEVHENPGARPRARQCVLHVLRNQLARPSRDD